ncbi:general negative regulator of transcription subunit 5 [Kickxella alabastrina]|uniref:General negative regulator of transcription subunit 5 n=1 Tax=Kickxella alabastrina TaxID=61397 RepID=A0ACC1I7I0_9FUNG|nr:general negative regulator of transcription subunit 5 [Kickxella alabastrina]
MGDRDTLSQTSTAEPPTTARSVVSSKSTSTTRPATSGSHSSGYPASSIGAATIVMPQPSTLQPAPIESRNAWSEMKESVLSPSRPGTTTGVSHALAHPWAAIASQHTTPASTATQKQASVLSENNSAMNIVSPRILSSMASSAAATVAASVSTSVSAGKGMPVSGPPNSAQPVSAAKVTETPVTSASAASASSANSGAPTPAVSSVPRASTSPVGTKRAPANDQSRAPMQRPKYFTLFQDSEVPDAFADLMATFMKAKYQFSAKKEAAYNAQRQMVDLSLRGIPSLLDQERPKLHAQPPTSTPSYYPQTPLPVIEHPGMASHLELDTLFFAFYYQPNTYQQYLAAKELNRQSWRFHKKYLTWFQRFEEPSDITDDYEQGTYIYFDYEGAWCQRRKTEFRFEYQYLEDTELA